MFSGQLTTPDRFSYHTGAKRPVWYENPSGVVIRPDRALTLNINKAIRHDVAQAHWVGSKLIRN